MFWLTRKRLVGSNLAFTAASLSRTIVTAPAYRNWNIFVTRKIYGCHYVCHVRATKDSVGTTIDHSIVHSPCNLVFVATRGNEASPQFRRQIAIGFFSHTSF